MIVYHVIKNDVVGQLWIFVGRKNQGQNVVERAAVYAASHRSIGFDPRTFIVG